MKEVPPVGITLSDVPGRSLCLKGGMVGHMILHRVMAVAMVWLNSQGLGMNMIRKLVTRKFGEEVCG